MINFNTPFGPSSDDVTPSTAISAPGPRFVVLLGALEDALRRSDHEGAERLAAQLTTTTAAVFEDAGIVGGMACPIAMGIRDGEHSVRRAELLPFDLDRIDEAFWVIRELAVAWARLRMISAARRAAEEMPYRIEPKASAGYDLIFTALDGRRWLAEVEKTADGGDLHVRVHGLAEAPEPFADADILTHTVGAWTEPLGTAPAVIATGVISVLTTL